MKRVLAAALAGASDYTGPAKLTQQLKGFDAAPPRYLMDEPGAVGMVYGAQTTPHMYVIDGCTVKYR